jgi:hypothetical protein
MLHTHLHERHHVEKQNQAAKREAERNRATPAALEEKLVFVLFDIGGHHSAPLPAVAHTAESAGLQGIVRRRAIR